MKVDFSLTVKKSLQKELGTKIKAANGKAKIDITKPQLFADIRKEFSKRGPLYIKREIIKELLRGISPVKGQGRLKKYSPSYIKAIRNEAYKDEKGYYIYRSSGGRILKIYVESKKLAGQGYIQSIAKGHKMTSPSNLRLTGDLHRSLKSKVVGGYFQNYKLVIGFYHWLADIHNSKGAGRSKVIRRMLPTLGGEQFNRSISAQMLLQWRLAATKTLKQKNLI